MKSYFLIPLIIIVGCILENDTPSDRPGLDVTGVWVKVMTINKQQSNDTIDYSDRLWEYHIMELSLWRQRSLKTGYFEEKQWKYRTQGDKLYKTKGDATCERYYWIKCEADTLYFEDDILIHKWVPFDTNSAEIWPDSVVVLDSDSIAAGFCD